MTRGVMDDDLSEQHLLDCAFNHYTSTTRAAAAMGRLWLRRRLAAGLYLDWLLVSGPWIQKEGRNPLHLRPERLSVTSCQPASDGFHTAAQVSGMYTTSGNTVGWAPYTRHPLLHPSGLAVLQYTLELIHKFFFKPLKCY